MYIDATFWIENTTDLVKCKKHKPLVEEIQNRTSFLDQYAPPLSRRLWHILYNNFSIPKCRTCNKDVSWNQKKKSYNVYCSNPKCVSIDPFIINKKRENTDYSLSALKRAKTNLERYGNTNYLATEEGKKRSKEYLIKNKDSLKSIRERTCLEKYGAKNVFELEEFQKKVASTKLDLYGDAYYNNREKAKITCLEKYGVSNPMKFHLIDWIGKIDDLDWILHQHYIHQRTFEELSSELGGIDPQALIRRVKNSGNIIKRFPVSGGEKCISKFLEDNHIYHETNIKSLIPPYEIDIYIPSHNLAIEYCGLYWHSEQKGKDKNYHKNKWERCYQKDIQLITIYEDEWLEKNKQAIGKIKSLLHIDDRKRIYARNTNILTLSKTTKKEFLDNNHIQGNDNSSIYYGLSYNDEIVAVMTFSQYQNGRFILNRYATSCHVIGGFTKLVEHFKRNNEWKEIVSFADLRWSNGHLYKRSEWILDIVMPPDYYYSPDGCKRHHKFNYRHKFLPEKLLVYDPSLTEKENCDINGILRIWDCGKKRYKLCNDNK